MLCSRYAVMQRVTRASVVALAVLPHVTHINALCADFCNCSRCSSFPGQMSSHHTVAGHYQKRKDVKDIFATHKQQVEAVACTLSLCTMNTVVVTIDGLNVGVLVAGRNCVVRTCGIQFVGNVL